LVEIVAKTIYGEARDFGVLDRLAVGAVIRERVLRPGWWGNSWESVCLCPGQFTCWEEERQEILNRAYSEDHRRLLACWSVAEYIVNHLTDEDATQLFGKRMPIPTHYHLTGVHYPKEWGEPGIAINVSWDSRFKFYAGVNGAPERKG
jgi:hypothetical protein